MIPTRELKHCFISEVKHWFIPPRCASHDNQGVLNSDDPDNEEPPADDEGGLTREELAQRLTRAMDEREPKITQTAIAKQCRVQPQAITGWRKTGRVHKRHLLTLSDLLGVPIYYFIDPDYDAESLRAQGARLGLRWMKLPERYRSMVLRSLEEAVKFAQEDAAQKDGDELGVEA